MNFSGFTLTGNEAGGTTTSFNKVTVKDLTGGSARLSVGYQF